jgi:DNA-nicking Smr family endonuclease
MSRRRPLSDDEQALWSGFARSITPLRPSRKSTAPSAASSRAAPAVPAIAGKPPVALPRAAAPRVAPAPAPLDRRFKQRVARGREPIDARIDLHGMTQSEAHAALLGFLRRAQADGARTVIVVTGKGSEKITDRAAHDVGRARGVLRRQVPLWLALPEFRPLIVGFDIAHAGHGGQGALYVRLRREK